jgi:hypothetical protein
VMDSLERTVLGALLTLQPSWIQISPGPLLGSSVWDASFPSGLRVTVERYPSQLRMTASGPAPTSRTPETRSTGSNGDVTQLAFQWALDRASSLQESSVLREAALRPRNVT